MLLVKEQAAQVGRQNTLGRGTSLPARLKQMVGEGKQKASTVLQILPADLIV
jgi:hypothetical protein